MIETITNFLLYALVFTLGYAFGVFYATKAYLKRSQRFFELLNTSQKVIQNQMDIIEGMKQVRPVFKTVDKEGGQNDKP